MVNADLSEEKVIYFTFRVQGTSVEVVTQREYLISFDCTFTPSNQNGAKVKLSSCWLRLLKAITQFQELIEKKFF